MSALSSDVNNTLINVLHGFGSADNNIRAAAEETLNNQWITEENIHVLLVFLAEQASFSEDLTLAGLSAVLFRKLALRAPPSSKAVIIAKNITHISKEALEQIRTTLLKGFVSERSNGIRHKLSDAIAECAQDDLPAWPELLRTLFEATKNQNPNFRESSFRIFSTVPHLINAIEITNALPIFEAGFTDTEDDVKIAAVTAFVGYFKQLPKMHWAKLGVLLPSLLNSLPKFLDDGKDDALAAVFESLIELVELAPKLFKSMFDQMIQFTDMVIKNKDLETSARTTALELLTVFSECAPQMCKSNPNYAQSLIMDTLLMMTEVSIDDDQAIEWQNSDDVEEDDEETAYDNARQALDRVALKLNGKYLAPILFQYLQQMVGSAEWRERFGALMALSSAAEGCRDVLIGEIPKILDMVIPLINDPHPRVQYGCCNVLGQISTDFAPLIQRTSHERILPALISKLTGQSVDRVQTHAAAALVNFSEHATQIILEPYLDSLLTNLLSMLQSSKLYVQEQALTTIAFIAEAAEKKFIKYYDTLMPLLLSVLKTDTGKENRTLKGKCMECATLIALAVGKDKFSAHSQELIELFISYQNEGVDDDDPIKTYLEQGWSRICRILREDFVPFLPIVLPSLLETAKAGQDVSLIDEEEAKNFQQYTDWDVVQIQGKHIAIHTSILDDKVPAMELLQVYATILKNYFAAYVPEIMTEIAIKSLDFYLHDGVRATGAGLIPVLFSSLVSATGVQNPNTVALWELASTKLINSIISEPMPEIVRIYHASLVDGLKIMGDNALTNEQLEKYTKGLSANLSDVFERVRQRHGQEDEYNEDVDEEYEDFTDEDLLDDINKSLAAVFQTTNGVYLTHFQSVWPLIHMYLQDSEVILTLFALVAISDMVHYCGDNAAMFKDSFAGKMKDYLVFPEPSIRQAAAYCIGSCAQYAPNTFGEVCMASLDTLFLITTIPDAKSEDNISATENTAAAVAKILHSFGANIPTFETYVVNWLKSFPILQDEEAAAFNYRFLGHLIDSNNPTVHDKEKLGEIVDYVVQALHQKSISGKVATAVVDSTKKLLSAVPQEEALRYFQRYPSSIMQDIQTWFA
ncbi:AGL349Cp [Eremothecium gossypii ATCC 10895]|uniref:AGL349Cp n=1 Tax=Eremothecium gossypii (strain ATCC 10895 / CBS 109.51 / FGSC 9923 / NRRL Y-1056) TaxID=284811 RepID=Q751N9_EREGS|nr:AGL349Cp [Eremothecium gossypii ATCC 10895]AAS54142.2 AGL349Cp [Eremothecium gossypii ATCC 10895]AEY98468.1 FAGL349Cp [Eremothecium gossypii FDAG1]